jgi:hypothetical protein
MAQAESIPRHSSMPGRKRHTSFYLWSAIALGYTVAVGFWLTYFGPLFRGAYPQVSPLVHVHGWSFFAWYLLFAVQASLIHSQRVTLHRRLGLASTVLATVMIAVGLIVSTVRIDMSLGPDGDPFWALMGVPIFSIWILFTAFYGGALHYRRRAADHKRLMLLASAVAAAAATFRIFVEIFGLARWVAIAGTLAPSLFIVAGMVHDYRTDRQIHPVYAWGLTAMIGVIGGAFLIAMTPGGEGVKQAIAWIGRLLSPFY